MLESSLNIYRFRPMVEGELEHRYILFILILFTFLENSFSDFSKDLFRIRILEFYKNCSESYQASEQKEEYFVFLLNGGEGRESRHNNASSFST